MDVLSTGCQWRAIPKNLPPRSKVHGYLDRWTWDRTLDRIHQALDVACREQAEREASPSAAIIDSQSVKSAGKGGLRSARGSLWSGGPSARPGDAGKKIKGKKRHILVDTQGLLMQALVHAAGIQDRDGGVMVMAPLFGLYPFLLKPYADGGYQGERFQKGVDKALAQVNVEIVKRSEQAKGFVVLPKRWIVERTFAWLGRCRRLVKDWECLTAKALAFLKLASIRLMIRKLGNPS